MNMPLAYALKYVSASTESKTYLGPTDFPALIAKKRLFFGFDINEEIYFNQNVARCSLPINKSFSFCVIEFCSQFRFHQPDYCYVHYSSERKRNCVSSFQIFSFSLIFVFPHHFFSRLWDRTDHDYSNYVLFGCFKSFEIETDQLAEISFFVLEFMKNWISFTEPMGQLTRSSA